MKGHINEMAIRLEDEDERISNLAKLFFHELSKKGKFSESIRNIILNSFGYFSCIINIESSVFFPLIYMQEAIQYIICFQICLANYPTRI